MTVRRGFSASRALAHVHGLTVPLEFHEIPSRGPSVASASATCTASILDALVTANGGNSSASRGENIDRLGNRLPLEESIL